LLRVLDKSSGGELVSLCSTPPSSVDMRDVFILPIGLG
jgi:hypothetical protein